VARRELTLVKERKLSELINPPRSSKVLEASGVTLKGGDYYVVFDNMRRLARIDPGLSPTSQRHAWFGKARSGEGYEDIAWSAQLKRFFLLIEAEKHPDGTYKSMIDEVDERGTFKARRWVDFNFTKRNTGFEGLSAIRWKGKDYLLALCEGNRCKAGKPGRKGGGGRIQVLARKGRGWAPVACIKLPKSVMFEDYSAVALRGTRIAVISQMTARLWIGTLRVRDWTIAGRGRTYDFPRKKSGQPKYCTLEGMCWLSDRSFVMVSDLSKAHYPGICHKSDQSIFLFNLPSRTKK